MVPKKTFRIAIFDVFLNIFVDFFPAIKTVGTEENRPMTIQFREDSQS
jgi:hypothetical protein